MNNEKNVAIHQVKVWKLVSIQCYDGDHIIVFLATICLRIELFKSRSTQNLAGMNVFIPILWVLGVVAVNGASNNQKKGTDAEISILVEGWTKWLTSYSLVNRNQLSHLHKYFAKTYYKEQKPFLSNWLELKPLPSLNETIIDRQALRKGQYDAVYRIQFPIDITTGKDSVPTFLFYTAEYQAIEDPNRYTVYDSFQRLITKCKDREIYPVTPSQWSAQALHRHGIESIVVPHGVDLSLFYPRPRVADIRNGLGISDEDAFVFLNIGNFLDTKSAHELIAAFLDLTLKYDDIYLIMKGITTKTYPNTRSPEWLLQAAQDHLKMSLAASNSKKLRNLGRMDLERVIFVVDDEMSDEDISDLYNVADCYVSPYKGEGFNLPVLEAMASGLPVIVTAGGSTDDFVFAPSAVKIPSRIVERYADRGDDPSLRVYNPLQLHVEHDDIVKAMKHVKDNNVEYLLHANSRLAKQHVANYSWEKVTASLAEAIKTTLIAHRDGTNPYKDSRLNGSKNTTKQENQPPLPSPQPQQQRGDDRKKGQDHSSTTSNGKATSTKQQKQQQQQSADNVRAKKQPTSATETKKTTAKQQASGGGGGGGSSGSFKPSSPALRKLLVEGWVKWLTSYTLVNRHQLAYLPSLVDNVYLREVKPFLNWLELPTLPNMHELITGPEADTDEVDAVYRIHYPYNTGPATRGRGKAPNKHKSGSGSGGSSSGKKDLPVFIFYTAEYASLGAKHNFMEGSSLAEFRRRCKSGEIIPVTPSHWSARALLDPPHCIPIVAPHGFNTTLFRFRENSSPAQRRNGMFDEVRDGLGIPQNAFVFLNIGSMLGTKSIPELLLAFLDLCQQTDEAYLVLKGLSKLSYPNARTPEYLLDVVKEAILKSGQLWSKYEPFVERIIFIIEDEMTEEEIADLYAMADCYVSPYKGEGFNLPVLEAMASGLPVIVTAGGSTDDFVYPKSVIKIPSREVNMNDYPGGGVTDDESGTMLAVEQMDIINAMIDLMNNRATYFAAARSRGTQTHLAKYSWKRATATLVERLDEAVRHYHDDSRGSITSPEQTSTGGKKRRRAGVATMTKEEADNIQPSSMKTLFDMSEMDQAPVDTDIEAKYQKQKQRVGKKETKMPFGDDKRSSSSSSSYPKKYATNSNQNHNDNNNEVNKDQIDTASTSARDSKRKNDKNSESNANKGGQNDNRNNDKEKVKGGGSDKATGQSRGDKDEKSSSSSSSHSPPERTKARRRKKKLSDDPNVMLTPDL